VGAEPAVDDNIALEYAAALDEGENPVEATV
jgi:hypothetical protein